MRVDLATPHASYPGVRIHGARDPAFALLGLLAASGATTLEHEPGCVDISSPETLDDDPLAPLPDEVEELRLELLQKRLLGHALSITEAAQLEWMNALVERSMEPMPSYFAELRRTTAALRALLESHRRGPPDAP